MTRKNVIVNFSCDTLLVSLLSLKTLRPVEKTYFHNYKKTLEIIYQSVYAQSLLFNRLLYSTDLETRDNYIGNLLEIAHNYTIFIYYFYFRG